MGSARKAVFVIFLIVFVDVLGFTIILPLLPFYAESFGATPFQVGLLVTMFALCQFISGPTLGRLSDRFGRKRILLFSQFGTFLSFVMLALANSLPMVFLARIIDGITAGNITVAQAYLSDVTEPKDRARAFGVIGISFGLGFFIGPAISSALANFGHSYPAWAAAFFSFTSVCCTQFLLPRFDPRQKVTEVTGPIFKLFDTHVLMRAMHNPEIRKWLLLFFLFNLSFSASISGFALYAERRLTWEGHPFGAREVGFVYTYLGLLAILVQGFFIGRLVHRFGEEKVSFIGFAFQMTGYGLYSLVFGIPLLFVAATLGSIGAGLVRPTITSLLTQKSPRDEQGAILGVSQSLASIGAIIAPIISGALIEWQLISGWALWAACPAFIATAWMTLQPSGFARKLPQ
jgi:MFS family permease